MSASLGQLLTVHKCDSRGRLVRTWAGRVAAHDEAGVTVEAEWASGHLDLGLFAFERGDCFRETYYLARWWNVYEVRSPGGELRGWYCNVARPARLLGQDLYFDDLALDLLVSPVGRIRVVDQDEFRALRLDVDDPAAYRAALRAVREIRTLVARGLPPFVAQPR